MIREGIVLRGVCADTPIVTNSCGIPAAAKTTVQLDIE